MTKIRVSNDMMESMKEAQEIEKHPENYKSFDDVDKFMEDLHSEIQTEDKK